MHKLKAPSRFVATALFGAHILDYTTYGTYYWHGSSLALTLLFGFLLAVSVYWNLRQSARRNYGKGQSYFKLKDEEGREK